MAVGAVAGADSRARTPDVDAGGSRARANVDLVDLTEDDDGAGEAVVNATGAHASVPAAPALAGSVARRLEDGVSRLSSGAGGGSGNIQPGRDAADCSVLAPTAAESAGMTSSCTETVVGKRPREQESDDDDSRDQVCVCVRFTYIVCRWPVRLVC